MPVPVGIVIEPPTPDAVLPPDRLLHHSPDGPVVWITSSATVGPNVTIEPDVQLGVGVTLSGTTTVARGAELGNNVEIVNGTVEAGAHVGDDTVIEGGTIREQAQVGQDNRIETGGIVGKRAFTCTGFLVAEGEELDPDSVNEFPKVGTGP